MAGFIMRKYHRFKKLVPIQYMGDGVAGEGVIEDFSMGGSSISGYRPVSVGMTLDLHILVPGEPEPLRIDHAIVQWAKGSEFGVDFGVPQPQVAERIATIISRMVKTERCSSSKWGKTQTGVRLHLIS